MFKLILIFSLSFCFFCCAAQSRKDSIRVVIALDAANDKIEPNIIQSLESNVELFAATSRRLVLLVLSYLAAKLSMLLPLR